MSSMNRFSASTRWRSPRSTRAHSLRAMTRGMMSNGHARSIEPPSSEYTVNVMPRLRMARSAAARRSRTSFSDREAR